MLAATPPSNSRTSHDVLQVKQGPQGQVTLRDGSTGDSSLVGLPSQISDSDLIVLTQRHSLSDKAPNHDPRFGHQDATAQSVGGQGYNVWVTTSSEGAGSSLSKPNLFFPIW